MLLRANGSRRPNGAVAAAARVPLAVVAETGDTARAAYGAGLVLVRPDQFVAWAGDDPPDDAAALIARAAGLSGTE